MARSDIFFLDAVLCRNCDTLEDCIHHSILPETTIFRDLWRAYYHIPDIDDYNFEHRTVNHNVDFVNSKDGTHVQQVESRRASVKRGVHNAVEFTVQW